MNYRTTGNIRSAAAIIILLSLAVLLGIAAIAYPVKAGVIYPDTLKVRDSSNYCIAGFQVRQVHQKGDSTTTVKDTIMQRRFRLEYHGDSLHVVVKDLGDLYPFYWLLFQDSGAVAWRRYIKKVDTVGAYMRRIDTVDGQRGKP